MATYASLSDSDKAVVQNTVQQIRALSGTVGRQFNALTAIANDTNAVNLITSIDSGETIPNQSGLAGADDMTRSELVSLWNELIAMQAAYDTAANRASWSKAAGINALLGVS